MSYRNLVDVYRDACRRFAHRDAIGRRSGGKWLWESYAHLLWLIDECRTRLSEAGVGPEDRVAVIADNRLEWAVVAYATYGLEAVLVPMYEAQLAVEREHVLIDSGARIVFASRGDPYVLAVELATKLPSIDRVVGLDLPPEHPSSFRRFLGDGDGAPTPARDPAPDALAALLYTPGTTGTPKGAELTHGCLASNLEANREAFVLTPDERSLSTAPWAHPFGQTHGLHNGISQGIAIAVHDPRSHLLESLSEVRPTVLVAVPRMLTQLHDAVRGRVAKRSPIVRRLFEDGLAKAETHRTGRDRSWLRELELTLDDRLIFSKVRKQLGGELTTVICGSASLDRRVAALLEAMGIRVFESYGLTETSPVVTANTPTHQRLGSAGRPLPGVRVEIDGTKGWSPGEGEIIVHRPNVMRGYHGRSGESRVVLTPERGLRTGDIGRLDEDGYLHITGRLNERYTLEGGQRVMPAPIEAHLSTCRYVTHVVLFGENHPYNVAVVSPDKPALVRWTEERGLELGDLVRSPQVRDLIEQELRRHGRDLRAHEVPRKALVVAEDFTTANGMLTPTHEVRRANVVRHHRIEIANLYLEDLRFGRSSLPRIA